MRSDATAEFYVSLLAFATQIMTSKEMLFGHSTGPASKPLKPFCENEVFTATCDEGFVILMTHARYGRMTLSRCVKRDYGHIGCSSDVLELADVRCSGRRVCDIPIPDALFAQTKPCPEDLKPHLEAAYTCVPVLTPAEKCEGGSRRATAAPFAYLASLVTEETGCGGLANPWTIEVGSGQQIHVVLFDFSVATRSKVTAQGVWGHGPCSASTYAVVQEQVVSGARKVTVCGGGEGRKRLVYSSSTNRLRIGLAVSEDVAMDTPYFLLKYEVNGCVDIAVTADIWAMRQGDHVVVRCNHTSEEFHLTCVGRTWIGDLGNCSLPGGASTHWTGNSGTFEDDGEKHSRLSYGRCLVVILLTASAVGFLMLSLGLLVLRRRRSSWVTKESVGVTSYSHSVTFDVTGCDDDDDEDVEWRTVGHVASVGRPLGPLEERQQGGHVVDWGPGDPYRCLCPHRVQSSSSSDDVVLGNGALLCRCNFSMTNQADGCHGDDEEADDARREEQTTMSKNDFRWRHGPVNCVPLRMTEGGPEGGGGGDNGPGRLNIIEGHQRKTSEQTTDRIIREDEDLII